MDFDSRRGVVLLKRAVYILVNEHLKKYHNDVLDQKTYLMKHSKRGVADAAVLPAQLIYLTHANKLSRMP